MGLSYFIAFDKKPNFDTYVNGKAIAAEAKAINKICKKLKLRTLDDLLDTRAQAASFDIPEEDLPAPKWFEVKEGVKWVDTLLQYIDENPKSLEHRAEVLSDLEEFQSIFAKIKTTQTKWHLQMDF